MFAAMMLQDLRVVWGLQLSNVDVGFVFSNKIPTNKHICQLASIRLLYLLHPVSKKSICSLCSKLLGKKT